MSDASAFLELDGLRLEHRWWGPAPAEAPTVVLLHEGLGAITTWRDFPRELSEATGCGVFAYARAGYGRSSPCALPRPLSYMHDEARAVLGPVLDAAQIREAVLVGHSDGGSIALIHAAERPHPSVRGLVLLAPHVFVEPVSLEGIAAARRAFDHGELRERLRRHHGENVDAAFEGWCGAWLDPRFRDWELESLLPGLQLPCAVLQGTADPYGTMAQARRIERGASGPVQVRPLEGIGHAPDREAPSATIDAVRHILAECNLVHHPTYEMQNTASQD